MRITAADVHIIAAAGLLAMSASTGTARADEGPPPGRADASAAGHDDLAEAIRLEAALEYDQALAIVERVIAAGTTTDPARLAELHLYAGRLAAGLDRSDAARAHFATALALNPALALPAGTSPKITAPFDAARASTTPLRVHATAAGAVIDADALGLVRRTDGFVAYDEHGNVVWRGAASALPPPSRHDAGPGLAGRWTTWAGVAGGALVVGGLCAWRFQVAQDDWDRSSQDGMHDYTQLRAIEDRGNRWGVATEVGFGVVAAAAVTAAVLYVVHRPAPIVVGDQVVGVVARF